ncbi:MAG: heparinase II/III family protein [Alphaproteobacteria bacterium]|nr:heparinase II/III family protein [Alphaproteobacteria bacterium]
MTQAAKLIGKVRQGVQSVAYGNPLYQRILSSGDVPLQLHFTPSDLWPGDAHAGEALLASQETMFFLAEDSSLRNAAITLRNLRAVGSDAARRMCIRLIDGWMQQFDHWDKDEWTPKNLGARLAAWIGFYDFYSPAGDAAFIERLVASIHRQWNHLARITSTSLKGVEAIEAARGLLYGGLNFPNGDKAMGLACALIQRQLASELLSDGGHISRNPSVQFRLLRGLVDIRHVLEQAEIRLPPSIGTGLTALISPLKVLRHGDGGLALFNGAIEETPLAIDAVLTQAVVRGRVLRRLPEMGYERMIAGRSLLLVDAGAPPPLAFGHDGHAGLLSFEFSVGRERLIVNCGASPNSLPEWRTACAATAAHSTLTIDDTNACSLNADDGIVGQVVTSAQRFEENGDQTVEMAHNGYFSRFGITHSRTLRLSSDGDTLSGRDLLQGSKRHTFTLRWHVHPKVQASLSQDGKTVLLRTAAGSGWRLRLDQGRLSLESSVYCGQGIPRRTVHVKASGVTHPGDTVVRWNLSHERKN